MSSASGKSSLSKRWRQIVRFFQTADYVRLLMMVIAAAFVIVSASFSVRFAQSVGAPSGNAEIFILMALAIEGFAAFALPAFWRGFGFRGRTALVCFLGLCLVYKITAADHFSAENYGARESSKEQQADQYSRARERVADLRTVLEDNAAARALGVVEADIRAAKQHVRWMSSEACTNATVTLSREFCKGFYKLQAELAMAKKAAAAQGDLADAIAKLDGMDPVAVAPGRGGLVPDLLALIGISVGGFTAFISKLCMMLVEGGSVVVPAMVGLSRRRGAEPETAAAVASPQPRSPEPETASLGVSATTRELTDRERAAIDELTAFLACRTQRQAGETVQSSRLYAAYVAWKEGQKGKALPIQMFGTVLTHHLGLTKSKIDGRHYYHNLRIVAPETARKDSGNLRITAAGAK